MESALIVLIISLFLVAVLVVLVPEALRLLAFRLAEQRRAIEREIGGLGRELQEAANRLRPFREMSAGVYQQQYLPARESLQEAVTRYRRAVDALNGLAPVSLPSEGLATPLFMREPQLYNRIIRNWRLQRRTASEFAGARASLARAQTAIAQLAAVPADLQQRSHRLVDERVRAVERTLAEERAAGIENLDDFAEQGEHLASEAQALVQLLRRQDRPPLPLSQQAWRGLESWKRRRRSWSRRGGDARAAAGPGRPPARAAPRNRVASAVGPDGPDAIVAMLEEADAQMAEAEELRPARLRGRRGGDRAGAGWCACGRAESGVVAARGAGGDCRRRGRPEQALRLRLSSTRCWKGRRDGRGRRASASGGRGPTTRAGRAAAATAEAVTRRQLPRSSRPGRQGRRAACVSVAGAQTTVAPLPGERWPAQALQRQRRAASGRPVLLEDTPMRLSPGDGRTDRACAAEMGRRGAQGWTGCSTSAGRRRRLAQPAALPTDAAEETAIITRLIRRRKGWRARKASEIRTGPTGRRTATIRSSPSSSASTARRNAS